MNNTGQSLVWAFVPDGGGRVQSVPFRRQRDAADSPVDLASNTNGGEFTVFPRFLSNYSASTPATLKLKNVVTKDAEFIYSIEVIYLKNVLLAPGFKDEVQVIVHGKCL